MNVWFTEIHTKNRGVTLRVKETLHREKSDFQEMLVVDTYEYGKTMILDDIIMLTEKDEFIYHEMITHLPLYTHKNPENVLIIGGGDGGTLRETIKHPCVKKAVLVEIDEMVLDVSRKYFPQVASGLDSPKAEIMITDGIKYVKETQEKYDLIIIDSTDPIGPAIGLFHKEFYQACFNCLNDDGMLVCQSETPFLSEQSEYVKDIHKSLKQVFPHVQLYLSYIPTYPSGAWGLTLASKQYKPADDFQSERYNQDKLALKYYNSEMHFAALALPNFVKELLNIR
jgi:spermidine synthase